MPTEGADGFSAYSVGHVLRYDRAIQHSKSAKWLAMSSTQVLARLMRVFDFPATEIACRGNAEHLAQWLLSFLFTSWLGDFQHRNFEHRCVVCYAAFACRLVPAGGKRTSDNYILRQVFAAVGSTLAVSFLASPRGTQQLRVAARVLPYAAHRCLLHRDWSHPAWTSYAQFVWKAVSHAEHDVDQSILYLFVHIRCRAWYIGKVQQQRVMA